MWTHLAEKNRGKSGQDDYSDRMVTHDEQIGQMLDKLDELGVAPSRCLFVAGSAYDLFGTSQLGLATYWHDRIGMTPPRNAPP